MTSTECQARCGTSPFGNVVGACVIYSHMALKVIRFFPLEALYPLFASTSSTWSMNPKPFTPLTQRLSGHVQRLPQPGQHVMYGKGTQEDGNQSSLGKFILLGVSDQPQLERLLFVLILISYTMTLLGNTTIIVVSWLDPHLHTPMYFFLRNLSFLDLCYTTSVGPQMLVNFRGTHKSISWAGCVAQLYISLSLGCTECLLLAIMAYDRYAAICQPLRYTAIMSHRFCLQLAATAWLCSFGNSMLQTILILRVPRCGRNQIDNLFCELPALLKLACVDTSANEAEVLASSVIFLLVPLGFILMSYSYIGAAVLKIRSVKGRLKAFNTCASHLAVVSIFYGTGISTYLQPPSRYSQHQGKIIGLFYTMVAPMLNPLIYTLRNKEVHRALQRALRRNMTAQGV
ncbi:putative olfactory receptor 2B8 [Mauremys reevesii]|uniref:putative olfactory receptor 2B8 n=1 Tax=Mauremys reevesii TaxID=260615 RepID=UPI00193F0E4B|nr:putative olfactory receptor 2B8 [Mauremys reevesii]